jgi:invasion protein IalB
MNIVSTLRAPAAVLGATMLLLALGPYAGAAWGQSAVKPGSAAPAPAATAPAAASSAAPSVPTEPSTTTASFGDWVLRCQRLGDGEAGSRICEVAQAMQAQGQKTPFVQIAIGRPAAGEPLRVTLVLLPDLSFPSSAQVVGDGNGPVLDLPWRRCLPGGCFADAVARDDVLKRWRGLTEPGRIVVKSASGREVAIPLSFRGLAPALDALAKERA